MLYNNEMYYLQNVPKDIFLHKCVPFMDMKDVLLLNVTCKRYSNLCNSIYKFEEIDVLEQLLEPGALMIHLGRLLTVKVKVFSELSYDFQLGYASKISITHSKDHVIDQIKYATKHVINDEKLYEYLYCVPISMWPE